MLKEYKEYLQDNPKGYWFKSKLYGWGWAPVTWQGWTVFFIYLTLTILFALTIDGNSPPREIMFTFILPFILLTITFIRICYKTGERPRWSWGKSKKNKKISQN